MGAVAPGAQRRVGEPREGDVRVRLASLCAVAGRGHRRPHLAVAVRDDVGVFCQEVRQVASQASAPVARGVEAADLTRRQRRDGTAAAASQLAREPEGLLVAGEVGVQLVPELLV
eukprot:CAMPEP_0119393234 /NCGR_PEP_ID=MMETSP1334-20130426/124643_1 /TAXON_ID=127549 /ORGANISM="Calcidiscus leptoporus, Strain RCC1130" /LENGTH=114 /DNA_ID=CAMNT_0007416253 /DNA_START=196 /DNA_END=537 /DNA_ORIENTATION=+